MATNLIKIPKGKPIKIRKTSEIVKKGYHYDTTPNQMELWDNYATHHTRLTGYPMDYFELDPENTDKNAFFQETLEEFNYGKPFRIYAHINWNSPDFKVDDHGSYNILTSALWISRKELENNNVKEPSPGDIIRIWDLEYYRRVATNSHTILDSVDGLYFDVVESKDDGHAFDTPFFVGFRVRLKRNSKFGAERKLPGFTETENNCE